MGDMENTFDDVTTDVDNEEFDTTDTQDDTTDERRALLKKYKIDPENFTEDDLLSLTERLHKAEQIKIDNKKSKKVVSDIPSDIMTKADYAMEKFLDKNPELSEYTKELESYTKKGLSFDEAKVIILNSDKAKQNREKTNSLGLSDGEDGAKRDTYTQDELAKMPPEKAQKLWTLASQGKIKVR